jgi:hypothetical protein
MSGRGLALLGAEHRPQPPLAHFSDFPNRELDPGTLSHRVSACFRLDERLG